ncbi:MAG: hypothetical protein EAZ57_08445 [Cytophagales bacterium]|nr:MAG: hypothetical protein EAZ67_05735 [Cytophagales bacterium]TAF60175.1 MAG: hypothetical protein EAZ57_08445 [Cytophagales bacterium]
MNKKLFLVAILLHWFSFAQAQDVAWLKTSRYKFQKTEVTALEVTFEAPKAEVDEALEKHLKKNYKAKVKDRRAEGIIIPEITTDKLEMFYAVKEKDGGSVLFVGASKGYDLVLTPERFGDEYQKFKTFVYNFSVGFNREFLMKQLAEAQKQLEDIQRQQADLAKNNQQLNDKIKNNTQKISDLTQENTQAEQKIKDNNAAIEQTKPKIDDATKRVKDIESKIGTNK